LQGVIDRMKNLYKKNALLVTVMSVGLILTDAGAQDGGEEKYSLLLAEDGQSAWRLDHDSGTVSFCVIGEVSEAPECSPWGPTDEVTESGPIPESHDEPIASKAASRVVEEEFGCAYDAPPTLTPADYYSGLDTLRGATLRRSLNILISTGVKKLTYKQVWDALGVTDQDPCNSGNVILIYTARSQDKALRNRGGRGQNDMWSREHVWPKSHGFRASGMAPYTDIHHLRPADTTVNSSRGHKDFAQGGDVQGEANGTFRTSQTWEPRDSIKGDVARMMFYMAVRYEGGDGAPDLQLVDQGTKSDEPKLGYLCELYSWHHNDPVNKWERRRNGLVQQEQGNRNPFIDHPEWVEKIWSDSCTNDTTV
jgi:endonuclease I